ncbi:adenosylcobinamide-GDP ribazoletransferase [uncultured Thermanaerothrix sp.]|uniref:adenosylcobinamide-GDP ribazoletransferase n=1 Tax=uncultured Thermanaerothrix sp. TaxID=1195149 RepID=UPI002604CE66|nr:adenosylcobinamide-GDP ribazoletransferase [uncultured Thermanaerothrix sp.]
MSSSPNCPWQGLRLALAFLTRLPLPSTRAETAFEHALPWFPWVGLLFGAACLLLAQVLGLFFSPLLVAVLTLIAWSILSGFLHLDGLADCWDALFPPLPTERRWQVLKDPHLGAFGIIGLVLHLLLKITALISVLNLHPLGLLIAPVWARWLVLWVGRLPPARPEGLGAAFVRAVTPRTLLWSSPLPLLLIPVGGWYSLIALPLAAVSSAALGWLAQRRLGGISGDVLGAVIETSEVAVLLGFALS